MKHVLTIEIDCEEQTCGECHFFVEGYCGYFEVSLEDSDDNEGWENTRCPECLKLAKPAEVK